MTRIADRVDLLEKVGEGRTGEVYRARLVFSGEIVAVKRLNAEALAYEPDALLRFQREAEALQMIDHPNIVKVKAAFGDGSDYYIVTEYVGGGSLRSRMDVVGQMPLPDVLDIALDLGDALARAHRLKIVHRDVKPANVLFATDGSVRLSDFGAAYIGDRSRITDPGDMIGTVYYMAPEALRSEPLDGRADIWSFGVLVYEMLAGRLPFQGATFKDWLEAVTTLPPFDLQALRPDVPDALGHVIRMMLAKDPADRIASTRQIGAMFEGILETLNR